MVATGVVYKDLLPIPHETDMEKEDISLTMRGKPTESHALAMQDHEEKGAAQIEHDAEVVNLGWNEPAQAVENPLVGGLSNEDLWVLVRRFNKVRGKQYKQTELIANRNVANVSRERNPYTTSWWLGPQYCRG